MRLNIILYEAFCRELRYFAAQSGHLIDIDFQPFGLNDTLDCLKVNTPIKLTPRQKAVTTISLIGYGLCSQRTAVLTTEDHTPWVIPRAHDCIILFLGSE